MQLNYNAYTLMSSFVHIKSLMPHAHIIYFRARDIRGTGADDEIRNCRTIANVMNNLSKLVFIFIINIYSHAVSRIKCVNCKE